MRLNLPIDDQLAQCQNLLIAGAGGGFDVFCGLPIYFERRQRGQNVHLASFSFSDIEHARHGERLTKTLVGVQAEPRETSVYYPEHYLARWFKDNRGEAVTVWAFHKTGADPLLENYRTLVEHLKIDGILLIDGGVDSLVRGDEAEVGTLIEDATSLFAVNELTQVPTRLLACIGFGAERDMAYPYVLENIAALTQAGGFLGACSLAPHFESYQAYEQAVLYVQNQPYHDVSVINSSIISAVRGHYGDYHLTEKTKDSYLSISPLMAQYWFFQFEAVVQRNLFLPLLQGTRTFREALHVVAAYIQKLPKRRLAK